MHPSSSHCIVSVCIHMLMAVRRLPEQHLINDYVPSCEPNGKVATLNIIDCEDLSSLLFNVQNRSAGV